MLYNIHSNSHTEKKHSKLYVIRCAPPELLQVSTTIVKLIQNSLFSKLTYTANLTKNPTIEHEPVERFLRQDHLRYESEKAQQVETLVNGLCVE